jgi:A/G-specific adenine glycosylase
LNPASLLLDWFSRNARALPWREGYNPYKILVSEFMLQQTRVETVLPYFERWMSRYPDLTSLAEADEEDVLKLWEGLGYYSRCRSLLAAARAMAGEGFRQPPSSAGKLSGYPGIGPYTAGAVASIAYNVSAPAVDGNVERVVARLSDIGEAAGSPALRRAVTEKVMSMMPEGKARAFNQALMELGALVCLPKRPACARGGRENGSECPWEGCCLAKEKGVQEQRPLPRARPAVEKIAAWAVLLAFEDAFLLRRRPPAGLWAGLWEVPWFARETDSTDDVLRWARTLGVERAACGEIGKVRFSFTHHDVTAWLVSCDLEELSSFLRERLAAGEWGLHGPEDLRRLTLPAPSRKFLEKARVPEPSIFAAKAGVSSANRIFTEGGD